jgi:CheY-like chemotaxis protein
MALQPFEVANPTGQDTRPGVATVTWRERGRKPGVLVVDDEMMVRELLKTALRVRGFEVWVAAGGEEALALYQQHREVITLVLLDVRMPEQDGLQTLSALQRIDPAVRCCFMSGDLGPYDSGELLRRGALSIFTKPFQLMEVAKALRQLADSVS